MTDTPLKIALVGAGAMGAVHAAAIQKRDDARLVAVVSPSMKPFSKGGDYIKGEGSVEVDMPCYPTLEKMLESESDLDIIDICSPSRLHRDQTIASLEAGSHVLLEKPMGTTPEECREIIDAVERAGRKLMVAQCLRFWPPYQLLREIATSGRFGALRRAEFSRHAAAPPEAPTRTDPSIGGAVINLHVHDVDVVHWIFGEPAAMRAFGVDNENGCNVFVSSVWTQADGAILTLQANLPFHSPTPFRMGYWAEFEEATVTYDTERAPEVLIHRAGREDEAPELSSDDGYIQEIGYFIECVKSDAEPELCAPASTMKSIELVTRTVEVMRA